MITLAVLFAGIATSSKVLIYVSLMYRGFFHSLLIPTLKAAETKIYRNLQAGHYCSETFTFDFNQRFPYLIPRIASLLFRNHIVMWV